MFWTFAEPESLDGERLVIGGAAGHHLARALRLRAGEQGVVMLGSRQYLVEVVDSRGDLIEMRTLEIGSGHTEPGIEVTLFQAVLPNPDLDSVIEAGTEVGVSHFVPIQAARSVARPAATRVERWQAIARSAAEQSHRGRIPSVGSPLSLSGALALDADLTVLVLHPAASLSLRDVQLRTTKVALAVGPEGGWSAQELEQLASGGGTAVTMGPRVLRARLAGVIATAILVQQS
jgi:16S rRNA (uracil1498-N3)-methyltransferase